MAQAKRERLTDVIFDSFDTVGEVAQSANERTIRLAQLLATDITRNQQEVLEVAKQLINAPTEFAPNYTAAIEAMAAAQTRAVAFAQAVWQETLNLNNEAIEKSYKANRAVAETAVDRARELIGEGTDVVANSVRNLRTNGQRAEVEVSASKN